MKEKRNELIECLSNLDKEMEELYLNEQQPTIQQIENCIRKLTLERKFYPVFMGSAYKNKGVQLALEGVVRFLPSPLEKERSMTPNHLLAMCSSLSSPSLGNLPTFECTKES